jgi:hypothetical protein
MERFEDQLRDRTELLAGASRSVNPNALLARKTHAPFQKDAFIAG